MFLNIDPNSSEPIYMQIYSSLKEMITQGMLPRESKLPSSRELAALLKVGRNTVISAYEILEAEGLICTLKGKGTFICAPKIDSSYNCNIDWGKNINSYAKNAEDLDIMKHKSDRSHVVL